MVILFVHIHAALATWAVEHEVDDDDYVNNNKKSASKIEIARYRFQLETWYFKPLVEYYYSKHLDWRSQQFICINGNDIQIGGAYKRIGPTKMYEKIYN